MGISLLTIAGSWGLPPMEWLPGKLGKDGTHYHIPEAERIEIYAQLKNYIQSAWQQNNLAPIVALCKETKTVRTMLGINHNHCNCE